MNYVEVLPLTKTGTKDQPFTYETELEISPGSIVTIPLKNRTVRGMVLKGVKKPKFPTRPVGKIQSAEPVLTRTQLALAEKIADYYLSTPSEVIAAILPFDFGKKRRPLPKVEITSKRGLPLKLTKDQEKIYASIKKAKKSSRHLIFGVTGSGKTEVYLQLIEDALNSNCGAIVLVPEISLTPQTAERFTKRFGETVAVWHSGLKETEKFDTWGKIKSGEKKVVLGARSAIFTPVQNLGYIVIDEEHETSYKQDQNPRYETTRVAEWLADLTGAKLVLGTATPKVETYLKSKVGKYKLWTLGKRIIQAEMPPVKIVDLRDEFRKGNKSIFSDDLYVAVHEALGEGKQVMLFVNRRGASTFVVCRDCGHVEECPNCETPLTFHLMDSKIGNLRCHHCGYIRPIPVLCPECKSSAIRYFGLGTQKVEIEARKMFPKARIIRMDSDTTRKRGSHGEIYNSFANKEYDIIIGTQLIAKGWDLPNVAVVGVISADTMLNLPDFRSAERTFSLLTQVAGRTGRGFHPGKVIVQTYSPENYAVKAAAGHDFESFFNREIKERAKYGYPPYSTIIKMTYAAGKSEGAEKEAARMAKILGPKTNDPAIQILGPSPAFMPKLAGKYRYQIVLKIKGKEDLLKSTLETIAKNYKSGWVVDVNPESLL